MRLAAKIEETFLVDFAAFENLSRVGEAPLHTIAKSIEKLQKSIGNLSSGTNKLSVLVYSQDDLDAESSAWNLSRKLRRVSPDGRKGIENLVDQEISRLSAKSVNPPQSGEGQNNPPVLSEWHGRIKPCSVNTASWFPSVKSSPIWAAR